MCSKNMEGRAAMRKRIRWERKKKRLDARLIVFALLALIVVAAYGNLRLRAKRVDYDKREQELLAQIQEEEKRTEEIEELKKYMETKMFVEEIAKERLGLVYEDEILFKAKE